MAERVVERTLSDGGLSIHYRLERLGGDLLLTVTGGAAHVGCVVLATHRQSLTGSGADSADSSVLNRSGHKDEFLLRALAERLSAVAGCAVAAVGGVHYDGWTSRDCGPPPILNSRRWHRQRTGRRNCCRNGKQRTQRGGMPLWHSANRTSCGWTPGTR